MTIAQALFLSTRAAGEGFFFYRVITTTLNETNRRKVTDI
jgi:hypothetical protein